MADVRAEIEEMIHRETRAWDARDAEALIELFHPDMVWPWPAGPRDHDPAKWIFLLGRFHRGRWKHVWEELFHTHELIHNNRTIRKIEVSKEQDAALAVVDIDTLWRDRNGRDSHWKGRVTMAGQFKAFSAPRVRCRQPLESWHVPPHIIHRCPLSGEKL